MSAQADPPLDNAVHRRLGVDLYNRVWTLLEKPERTRADEEEMVHAAHASRHHWGHVGTPANFARGEWLCSRVYATLGYGESARRHAERCLELVEENGGGFEDWDLAAAYEALARAHVVLGGQAEARRYVKLASEQAARIEDEEDREIIERQVAELELT
jgi:hypothetical protein